MNVVCEVRTSREAAGVSLLRLSFDVCEVRTSRDAAGVSLLRLSFDSILM